MSEGASEICHIEIPSSDLKVSTDFYKGVFGWEIKWDIPTYPFFNSGSVMGGFDPNGVPATGILLYLKTEDIEAKLEEIVKAGGKVIRAKESIGENDDHGFDARFADPSGNELGLWSAQ